MRYGISGRRVCGHLSWVSADDREFGFDVPELEVALFLEEDRIVRVGHPPLRVEIFPSASGVEFTPCYEERVVDKLGGVEAAIIGLECLKKNKRATGLDDLEHLP